VRLLPDEAQSLARQLLIEADPGTRLGRGRPMTTTTLPTRADELRVRIATLVEQRSRNGRACGPSPASPGRRLGLTRRLKGETPGFYFCELKEICRVLEVNMPDIIAAAGA